MASRCLLRRPAVKNARRYGTFKEAFRNKMALVYGTAGTKEENNWAYNRAKYDAEKLWYQGNASVDVLADTEFDPSKEPDRNVILYGNSRTHRLWKNLLPNSPGLRRQRARCAWRQDCESVPTCAASLSDHGREVTLPPWALSPAPGSKGSRSLISSCTLSPAWACRISRSLTPMCSTKGDAGIMLTGFFGHDWSMQSGEFVTGRPGEFVIGGR